MMRKMAGMMGMPDMSALMGGGGDAGDMDMGALPQLPAENTRRKLKKKPRHKKKR